MKLNAFFQVYGDLGIPIHSREFALALSKKIKNFQLIPISPNSGNYQLDYQIKSLIKSPKIDAMDLLFWYPHSAQEFLGGGTKSILYYIFEYTIIPKVFVEEINKLDAVCTASKWGVDVLRKNGVTVPCYVIPGGINPDKYSSKGRIFSSYVYRFLHIGKCEARKNTELTVRAFNEAFCGDEKIRLTLSIDNPHVQGFKAEDWLKSLSYDLKYPIKNIDLKHHTQDIRIFYNTHDCAVFPTMAEGIGLSQVECMAMGVPIITSNNTGITEYANDDNCILLKDLKEVPVYDENFFPVSGQFGTWMSPTIDELVQKLRWVYGNKEKAEQIGINAEKWMHTNFTWEQSANVFLETFK